MDKSMDLDNAICLFGEESHFLGEPLNKAKQKATLETLSSPILDPQESAYQNKKGTNKFNEEVESKEPWSVREELCMLIAHDKYKNKWSEMGSILKNRSNNTIKNKFYSIFRRIRGKIQKADFTYSNKLDLFEIYYIISVMEQYVTNINQSSKFKGKRGKDYIYSLMHNLSQEDIKKYKAGIQIQAKNEGDMDDLLQELSIEHNIDKECKAELKNDNDNEGLIFKSEYKSIIEKVEDSVGNEDLFISQLKMIEQEPSLNIEMDHPSSVPIISPLTLSAGAAATAARAPMAPCFTDGGFSDISSMAKARSEE